MSHHRRLEEPDKYYLLSNRTAHGKFFLRPDPECRRIIKGCLAREVVRKDVQLVAYCFPSNHFHIVAGFPDANRGAFMRDFEAQLSRRITDHRDYSEGMFPEKYHPKTILDPEALLDKISYTVNNAVRHGLVTHPEAWPGVGSIEQLRTSEPLVGRWVDHNQLHNHQRRKDPPPRSAAMIKFAANLHIPESLPGEDEEERRRLILERIEQDRQRFCREAGIDRHGRPNNPSHYTRVDWRKTKSIDEKWWDTRKVCAGAEASKVASYLEKRRKIDELFRAAAEAWKRGEEATFPVGTYPPGRADCVKQLEARAPPADVAA